MKIETIYGIIFIVLVFIGYIVSEPPKRKTKSIDDWFLGK
jgi:hypothetical protein